MSKNICKNCNGTDIVRDALGNRFFCPKCDAMPKKMRNNYGFQLKEVIIKYEA